MTENTTESVDTTVTDDIDDLLDEGTDEGVTTEGEATEPTPEGTDTDGEGNVTSGPSADPSNATFEKGTWQAAVQRAARLFGKSAADKKRASSLLWNGAQAAIDEWLENSSDKDVHGEYLTADLLDVMGTSRKGDVSKIKSVALAVASKGLVMSNYPNLSKAYAEARNLLVVAKTEASEDDAAEKAIEAIEAPKSTSTVDGAAQMLLSKGVDGAVVAILDALGGDNHDAHKAFSRAVLTEIASRVTAKAQAEKKAAEDKRKAAAAERQAEAEAKRAEREAAAEEKRKAKEAEAAEKKGAPAKKATTAKATGTKSGSTASKKAAPAKKAAVPATRPDPTKRALPRKKSAPVAVTAAE